VKILFLGKREPQQRDLIARPYGRFFHLPRLLAEAGDDVQVLLVSHRRAEESSIERDGVRWSSIDPGRGLARMLRELETQARAFRPDWIVGVSDAWYGWLAQRLALRTGARLAIDAYDNYEAYMRWNLPLHAVWRRAVGAADVVTAAGPQLAALLQRSRTDRQRVVDVVPMAADPSFVPHDRRAARQALGLPADLPLVGYMGGWASNRGTGVLLDAFGRIREQRPDARLVLTGRPPAHALATGGVQALGYVDDAQLPLALCSLDVACVVTTPSAFGRYSYPAKLCEAMACGVPVVATSTDPVRWMLGDDSRFLAPPGDAKEIARRVLENLALGSTSYARLSTWDDSARRFRAALQSVS
jgi:glycosyltransferase involved in cell wall biosynthesis